MTKNTRRRVTHKITMALFNAEGGKIPHEEAQLLRDDAQHICADIQAKYDSKMGAGALWLDAKLKDIDWLYNSQEAVIKRGQ